MLAKSKLNSLEKLISQALIDLEISHEEYKSVIDEEKDYRRLRKNMRYVKSDDELNEKEEIRIENNKNHERAYV